MWTLDKPELSRAKGKDVRELIANSDDLDESLKKPLRDLYQQYDDQQGRVTDCIKVHTKTDLWHTSGMNLRRRFISVLTAELLSPIH